MCHLLQVPQRLCGVGYLKILDSLWQSMERLSQVEDTQAHKSIESFNSVTLHQQETSFLIFCVFVALSQSVSQSASQSFPDALSESL